MIHTILTSMAFKCSSQLAFLLATFALTLNVAVAQVRSVSVQPVITVQAVLQEQGSSYANGTYEIKASLYADAAGTEPIWSASYQKQIENGLLNLHLGAGDQPLPSPTALQGEVWLGISINGSEELRPLTRMSSSIHALSIADRSVTKEKMATDYVASISVNGKKIAANGLDLNIVAGDDIKLDYDKASNSIIVKRGTGSISSDGKNSTLNQNTVVKGNLTVQQNTELGASSSNTIKFVGKASSDLNMNSKTVTGMSELTVGTSSTEGVLNLLSDGGGTYSFMAAPSTLDHFITIPEGLDGEMTLMMATTDGTMSPLTGVKYVGTEEDPITTAYTQSVSFTDSTYLGSTAVIEPDCFARDEMGNCIESSLDVKAYTDGVKSSLIKIGLDHGRIFMPSALQLGGGLTMSQPLMLTSGVQPTEGSKDVDLGTESSPFGTTHTGQVSFTDSTYLGSTAVIGPDCIRDINGNCVEGAIGITSTTGGVATSLFKIGMQHGRMVIPGALLLEGSLTMSQPLMLTSDVQPTEGSDVDLGAGTSPFGTTHTGQVSFTDSTYLGSTVMGMDCMVRDEYGNCIEGGYEVKTVSGGTSSRLMSIGLNTKRLDVPGGILAGDALTVKSTQLNGPAEFRLFEPNSTKALSTDYLSLTTGFMSENVMLSLPNYVPMVGSAMYVDEVDETTGYVSTIWMPMATSSLSSVGLASIAAGQSIYGELSANTFGESTGVAVISPSDDLPDGLSINYARVVADGTIGFKMTNSSVSTIPAATWNFHVSVIK